ncbi:hypothetical protein GCM10027578_44690 [Spirosoma luteolum]
MTVVAVELDDKVATDLKEVASSLQTPEADLVRKAISNYLRQLRMDRIQQESQPHIEAAGFLTDDDIYTEVS